MAIKLAPMMQFLVPQGNEKTQANHAPIQKKEAEPVEVGSGNSNASMDTQAYQEPVRRTEAGKYGENSELATDLSTSNGVSDDDSYDEDEY